MRVALQSGHEQDAVIALMRRCVERRGLPIYSAYAVPTLSGYIYIEADRDAEVKQAIQGLSLLSLGLRNLRVVPTTEVTMTLNVKRKRPDIKKEKWVRISRGLYKDDLAFVRVQNMKQ
jgi:transcription elongation factor SPT5